MITCYKPDGTPVNMHDVDARECVEYCGYSLTEPTPNTDIPQDQDIQRGPGRPRKGE